MSRNLKALGLALMAVFALSAIASASASATEATFTSGSNWTTLSASAKGNQVLKTSGGESIACESTSIDNATMGIGIFNGSGGIRAAVLAGWGLLQERSDLS